MGEAIDPRLAMTSFPRRTWWVRLLVSVGAGFGLALLVALVLMAVDLYQAGHGQPLVSRPWLEMTELGVHLSRADVVFLLAAVLGAGLTWRATTTGGA